MIAGIIFVFVLGTLFHFAYEWSGNNTFVGLFTPVNESVWEHTKLIFFPMLLFGSYASIKLKSKYPCIDSAFAFGALLGVILIIILFYTYSGILGFNISFFDISIFYISVLLTFVAVFNMTKSCIVENYNFLLKIFVVITMVLFFVFIFSAPDIALFVSP